MSLLFVSDVHLSPERPQAAQLFRDFLEREACGVRTLYILGDLFDVWLGDDAADAFQQQHIRALRTLSDAGVCLRLMHGNRDFLLGSDFERAAGAVLIGDPHRLELEDGDALLMHGDTLCTRDHDYLDFRRMVRDPQWQREFLAKSVAERNAIAAHYRTRSIEATSIKAQEIMDVTPQAVEECFSGHGVRLLVHGHTHRPAVHRHGEGADASCRIVLGAWEENDPARCLRRRDGEWELLSYGGDDISWSGPIRRS